MSSFDWDAIQRSKDLHRDKAAERPFPEKLLLLERLRERTEALRDRANLNGLTLLRPTANIVVSIAPSGKQVASGSVHIGFFGADVILTTAATSARSSGHVLVQAKNTTPNDRTN